MFQDIQISKDFQRAQYDPISEIGKDVISQLRQRNIGLSLEALNKFQVSLYKTGPDVAEQYQEEMVSFLRMRLFNYNTYKSILENKEETEDVQTLSGKDMDEFLKHGSVEIQFLRYKYHKEVLGDQCVSNEKLEILFDQEIEARGYTIEDDAKKVALSFMKMQPVHIKTKEFSASFINEISKQTLKKVVMNDNEYSMKDMNNIEWADVSEAVYTKRYSGEKQNNTPGF